MVSTAAVAENSDAKSGTDDDDDDAEEPED